MKRIIAWVLFSMLLLTAGLGVAGAATIPVKGSQHVQDGAGMFPKAQNPSLEKAASQAPMYPFYILTVRSFDGEKGADLARRIYKDWELQADDILVLISKGERRIEVHFNNADLQQRLDALPSDYAGSGYEGRSMLDQMIGKHFTPPAKKDDYVKGLLALIEAMNALPPVQPAAVEAGATAEEPAASPPPQAAVEETAPEAVTDSVADIVATDSAPSYDSRFDWGPWLWKGVAAGALLIIVLVLVIRALIYLWQLLRKKLGLKTAEKLTIELLRTRERFVLLADLYTAPPARRLTGEIMTELEMLLPEVSRAMAEITEVRLSYMVWPGKGQRTLAPAERQIKELVKQTKQIVSRIDELAGWDRNNPKIILELAQQAEQLKRRATSVATSGTHSLGHMLTDLDQLLREIEQVRLRQMSDLFDAKEALAPVQRRIELYGGLLKRLPELEAWMTKGPDKVANLHGRIADVMAKNGLKPGEIDPEGAVKQAQTQVERYKTVLLAGDLIAAAELKEKAESGLNGAWQDLRNQVRLKKKLEPAVRQFAERLQALEGKLQRLQGELVLLQKEYDISVWSSLPQECTQLRMSGVELANRFAIVKRQTAEQYFQQADAELTRLQALYEDVEPRTRQALSVYSGAVQRMETLRKDMAQGWSRYQRMASKASRGLPLQAYTAEALNRLSDTIEMQKGTLNKLTNQQPYQPQRIGQEVQQFLRNIEAYESHVTRMIREKEQAEQRMRRIHSSYNSSYSRVRSRSRRSLFSTRYKSSMDHVNKLMAMGLYADAMSRMAEAERSVQELRSIYEEEAREEQRQREMAREQEGAARSSSSSYSSSGSSGGDSFSNDKSGSSGGDNF
ncbi:septation ring formation regulator EzrA [Paenibacillus filicis]|uniref:Septation ring formation regulator EzrA n=1 Tax=Paenibacillus filicis TaxID=669464 RepID=A0ABU9DM88_9BACL